MIRKTVIETQTSSIEFYYKRYNYCLFLIIYCSSKMRFMYFQISHIKNEADYYHQYFEKGPYFSNLIHFFRLVYQLSAARNAVHRKIDFKRFFRPLHCA
jgi:hypothetical protein